MFGPPSSPPASYMSSKTEKELVGSLLPAFGQDHQRSSPPKMQAREFVRPKISIYQDNSNMLPTPLPTSEANMPSSPGNQDLISTDRLQFPISSPIRSAPLVPLIIARVPLNGESITIGRSSKSSKVSLQPKNRLASRVHVQVRFDTNDDLVKVECLGWNGLTVNVPQNGPGDKKSFPVAKGQVLNIERVDGITMDIHGDKVLIELGQEASHASDATEDELWSQVDHEAHEPATKKQKFSHGDSANKENDRIQSKPLESVGVEEVEKSTEPVDQSVVNDGVNVTNEGVNIVEPVIQEPTHSEPTQPTHSEPAQLEPAQPTHLEPTHSEPTHLEPTQLEPAQPTHPEPTHSEPTHSEPEKDARPNLKSEPQNDNRQSSAEPHSRKKKQYEPLSEEVKLSLQNVIANFVAYSRLSSIPFSSLRKANSTLQGLPRMQVREIIREVECVGIIEGSIEDTTGRKSEDVFYYLLEKDSNVERRQTVQKTKGHRSLRNCRKTPKQYFYRPLNLD